MLIKDCAPDGEMSFCIGMFTEPCKLTDLGNSTQKFTLKQPFGLESLSFRPQRLAKIQRNERILDRDRIVSKVNLSIRGRMRYLWTS